MVRFKHGDCIRGCAYSCLVSRKKEIMEGGYPHLLPKSLVISAFKLAYLKLEVWSDGFPQRKLQRVCDEEGTLGKQ